MDSTPATLWGIPNMRIEHKVAGRDHHDACTLAERRSDDLAWTGAGFFFNCLCMADEKHPVLCAQSLELGLELSEVLGDGRPYLHV